jgi:V/A-type H+-transporting ATPase subunit F
MKRIVVITLTDVEFGFGLTGVSHYVVKKDEAEITLRRIIKEPETGLIIVDEHLVRGIKEEKMKEIDRSWNGIIVVLPSPERPEVDIEDYAVQLIRRAIGYHVRLRL